MKDRNDIACGDCEPFQRTIPITSAKAWEPVILTILEGIKRGTIRVTDGELAWSDSISCEFQCTRCKRRFKVEIETYHGRGGAVTPVP